MDLQFCYDSYAVVTYVCDYWSKDETGMTEFLKQALKEAKSWENHALLSHLKRTYMAKRQIGKCEAIYRAIPTFHLQGANIACVFVQSGFPENQSTFLRKVRPKENAKQICTENSSRNSDSSEESDCEDDFKKRELKFRDDGQELIMITN